MPILICNASKSKGFSFYIKNKQNSEIFHDKESKLGNFNWESEWDGVKYEKFYYYGGSLKNVTFRGWGKTNI